MIAARDEMFVGPLNHWWAVVLATARAYLQRNSAYLIELVRWPLGPLIAFGTWRLTYSVAGRGHVAGVSVSGFLIIGLFGTITWSSALWASGYAIEFERQWGTSGALFLAPASRPAIVAGYGLGSFVWYLPSFVAIILLGAATGAQLHVTDPPAVLLAGAALLVASLCAGFAFAGLFILSRRGNLIANFLQMPIYLLAGFFVPRTSLPPWLHGLSDAIPASHAVDALRASTLSGASLRGVAPDITACLIVSAIYAAVGLVALRKVENVAKRAGQLDLY